jgi:gamma-F420-2:alpha-L-glutamate ligase
MNGWVLYKNVVSESWETQKLVEEFKKQDIKVRVVDPQDVDIFVDRDDRKSILVTGKARTLPDFVIPRTGSGTTYFIKAIIRHLERLGVELINGSASIDTVKDKLYTQQILGESNLPVPKTLLVKHPINIEFVEKNIGFPVIIKTLSGSFGAGVFLAENKRQFKDLIKLAEITKKSYNIIVQEFIKESFGKDIRAFVLNGKVIGCMMRQATDDDFRANITRGGEGIPYQIDDEIEWLGGECARLLGLDIAGVDLLFHNGGYVICEVNSSPGFEGMDSYTKTNIAEQIVHYVRLRLGIIESPKPKLTRFLGDGDERK